MSKTDKELTAEIVNNYLAAWFSSGKTSPLDFDSLQNLIKQTHKTIQDLPTK
ncbi:hypothetical protein [Enterococcus rotai]|uniref:hypothetical protein n=1 Tax=Enterococcus rotai TaxID=118060 RepID=UPI0032B367A7